MRRQSKWLDAEVSLGWTGRIFVLSSFQYCPLMWYFCCQTDMLATECVQKCMQRMVYEDSNSNREDLRSKSQCTLKNARELEP